MRASVKHSIGLFTPQGFLDGNNAPSFLTIDDISAAKHLNVDMLLVSLSKVLFFNRNGLEVFVKVMLQIRAEKHITVGFCDYDHKKYEAITKFYEDNLNFSLFKTAKIASLFAPSNDATAKNVLIYNDDASQRSSMAIELFDQGHNPIVAQSKEEFLEKKQNPDAYDVIVEDSYLGLFGQKIGTKVKGNAVIYTIGNYLDAGVADSFNLTYHNNSLNVGFRLFIFDAYKVVSMNIHAMNFFARLASSGAEYNATICFVGMTFEKTPEGFKQDLEDTGIMFFDHMDDILGNKDLLAELGGSSAVTVKQKRSLTKVLVNELPRLIDATVSVVEMMTNVKAVKQAAEVRHLNVGLQPDKLASSIGFYGDLDGMLILVFPKSIAAKACKLLIGEESADDEQILDAIGEFVNIIGGKIKALLSDYGIRVDITLPRTYYDIHTLLDVVADKRGVQVDLSFEEDNFIFFLTR